METKETPELLSRLNEIVERSRLRRDKRALPTDVGEMNGAGKTNEAMADVMSRGAPLPRRAAGP